MEENKNVQVLKQGEALDQIIEILDRLQEKARTETLKFVSEHFNIAVSIGNSFSTEESEHGSLLQRPINIDIRHLKEEKNPKSAIEMAALVAFYLCEVAPKDERKNEMETQDIERYFKNAGFPLPKKPQYLLINAKNAGYFDSVGSGKYKLNAVGYNLIAHNLPRKSNEHTKKVKRKTVKSKKSKTRS